MDARVGSSWRMSLANFSTGQGHSFGGTYLELGAGRELRYTSRFDDPGLTGEMTTTVTITKTLLVARCTWCRRASRTSSTATACYLGWQDRWCCWPSWSRRKSRRVTRRAALRRRPWAASPGRPVRRGPRSTASQAAMRNGIAVLADGAAFMHHQLAVDRRPPRTAPSCRPSKCRRPAPRRAGAAPPRPVRPAPRCGTADAASTRWPAGGRGGARTSERANASTADTTVTRRFVPASACAMASRCLMARRRAAGVVLVEGRKGLGVIGSG